MRTNTVWLVGWRPYALLAALCLLLYLPGIASIPPLDRDEARFAQATRQMLETGDFLRIRFQVRSAQQKAGRHLLAAGRRRRRFQHAREHRDLALSPAVCCRSVGCRVADFHNRQRPIRRRRGRVAAPGGRFHCRDTVRQRARDYRRGAYREDRRGIAGRSSRRPGRARPHLHAGAGGWASHTGIGRDVLDCRNRRDPAQGPARSRPRHRDGAGPVDRRPRSALAAPALPDHRDHLHNHRRLATGSSRSSARPRVPFSPIRSARISGRS